MPNPKRTTKENQRFIKYGYYDETLKHSYKDNLYADFLWGTDGKYTMNSVSVKLGDS